MNKMDNSQLPILSDSLWRKAWRRLKSDRVSMVSLVVIGIFGGIGLVGLIFLSFFL